MSLQYFPSKIFQAGINWTKPITQTDSGWVSHDDILSDTQIPGNFYRQTFLEKVQQFTNMGSMRTMRTTTVAYTFKVLAI